MTADAWRHEDNRSPLAAALDIFKQTLGYITKMFGYGLVLAVYAGIFIVSIATLALIEIRQANLNDFDALIAIREQQDRYFGADGHGHFELVLANLAEDIYKYRHLDACTDQDSTGQADVMPVAVQIPSDGPAGPAAQPKSCAEVKATANQYLYGLLSLQAALTFEKAKLPRYYDEYTDGLRGKAPQLIPLLRYVDSAYGVVTAWARLPWQLLEMLLLVCMGALGGVIAVTRCFVDRSTPNPAARDLCYRPVLGAVIALGIYVLFRATQLLFGGGGQGATATVSTSVFLLAALGLASGFCAREAVAQIEAVAGRILRRAEGDERPGDGGAVNAAARGGGAPPP